MRTGPQPISKQESHSGMMLKLHKSVLLDCFACFIQDYLLQFCSIDLDSPLN